MGHLHRRGDVTTPTIKEGIARPRARRRRGRPRFRPCVPGLPLPFKRMRWASLTPAGMRTFTRRGRRFATGAVTGRTRRRETTTASLTDGTHARHRKGTLIVVDDAAPLAAFTGDERTARRTTIPPAGYDTPQLPGKLTVVVTPLTASRKLRCSAVSRSAPRWGRCRRDPPKSPPNRSPKSEKSRV